MSDSYRVLATNPIDPAALPILTPHCELLVAPDDSEQTLRKLVADVDALIVRVRLPDDIFDHAPRLKACVRHGVGLDFIPVDRATGAGIAVANLPDSNTQAVAEHVIGAILSLARGFDRLPSLWRKDGWLIRQAFQGIELRGRTIGIVGLGRIGTQVASSLHYGFGMRVLGCDRGLREGLPSFIEQTSIEEVFTGSDVITLHAPLVESTKHLVDARLLGLAGPGTLLVNAARGGLIDDEALIEALRARRIGGAALDVFEPEPLPTDHPYWSLDNVLLTPHVAAFTAEGLARMSSGAARAVVDILHGRRPEHLVNPDAWPRCLERLQAR
ncbi:hydroxyacid dehydrogenase [Caballeronia sp. NCTM1]|uniref:hydroxyacid dehydrogenase n=1 Tax=Caballeronia sp. NCTM1 TaxID=2921753 RepID=UPI0020277B83|nr:hydroxyacid dehydrogenase [Caballeronia sp. NCTM1]